MFSVSGIKKACFAGLMLLATHNLCASEPLYYNLGTTGSSVPYENAVDDARPGIFVEILPLIMDRAGIETSKVMLSTQRAMRAFQNGGLDFDFFSPSWLSEDEKNHDFVFTDPILTITEYFITRPAMAPQYASIDHIHGNIVGTISGYVYFDDDKFDRLDFLSEKTLILGLGKGRVDIAIMEEAAARYWSAKHGIPITFGPVHTTGEMALRLHKKHADKVPQINAIIAELHQSGEFDRIIQKYADLSGVR
ncbi:transporter substrate-binding domain-containing protein [Alteromonas sp. KUL49]|uniref:substrate-binding periplasmic protein n=1 Tax=Alteromonas sp. KUL49 TaxID=2480798 RepID=UPI00102F0908|nr:transporter substrate-binding domain-containing protein [Alteromonas sp. KUL49]TAP38699.1 transporter substrate-binding domain-containing protein [Alteromonas sp. KUL49]GEA12651.1 hypothetical protein KUL49_30260 [Alteromonas sp. KUL49]